MEITESYEKTFSSFSGCDQIIMIDGKAIGEISIIFYEESLKNGKVKGYLDIYVFADSYPKVRKLLLKKEEIKNISITYVNEYSGKMHVAIYDVEFTKITSKGSVDDVSIFHRYFFKADRLEYSYPYKDSGEN